MKPTVHGDKPYIPVLTYNLKKNLARPSDRERLPSQAIQPARIDRSGGFHNEFLPRRIRHESAQTGPGLIQKLSLH